MLEDSLKPPALRRLSGRNGGQFIRRFRILAIDDDFTRENEVLLSHFIRVRLGELSGRQKIENRQKSQSASPRSQWSALSKVKMLARCE